MTVEIGSLVVRGTFGEAESGTKHQQPAEDALNRLRQELLEEMREMITEAERRRSGR